MLVGLLGVAFAQGCEPVDGLVSRMGDEVLEANLSGARELGRRAEASLGCGAPVSAETIGRLWVISGVLTWFDGDQASARRQLASGQRLAPGSWDPAYGEELTGVWSDLELDDSPGTLELSPALGSAWSVSIDGAPGLLPAVLPTGLHVIQVHHEGDVRMGQVVFVPADDTVRVSHTLPDEPAAAVVSAPLASPRAVGASLSLGIGVDASGGQRLEGSSKVEPPGKISLPVELGVRVEGGGLWFRPAAALGPLVGGTYLFSSDGVASKSPVGVGGHVAGGPRLGKVDVGLLAGVQWPGRIPLRLVGSLPLGELPLRVEGRLGMNVGTGSRLEPAATVNLSYLPWL